ncbi:MAG: hypothetical protein XD80_0145 [Synergistales bacterium 53_16]|nr:MAG: hypothetical protein XD80_0145 [Synergistales bacterium 53_16]MDN5335706.1 hypothetical protein [Synergistales bacterium]
MRRSGRVVEGGRLESVWAVTPRGFESLLLRQFCGFSLEAQPCAAKTREPRQARKGATVSDDLWVTQENWAS